MDRHPKPGQGLLRKGQFLLAFSKHVLKNLAPERPASVPWRQALFMSGQPVWDLALCVLRPVAAGNCKQLLLISCLFALPA